MDQQSVFEISFNFFRSKPVVVGPSPAQISSDGGLLAFRQLDEELGLTYQFAECLQGCKNKVVTKNSPTTLSK